MKIRGGPSPKKKQQAESEDGKVVITADNPVSCLYEYAKKVVKDSKRLNRHTCLYLVMGFKLKSKFKFNGPKRIDMKGENRGP